MNNLANINAHVNTGEGRGSGIASYTQQSAGGFITCGLYLMSEESSKVNWVCVSIFNVRNLYSKDTKYISISLLQV